MNYKSSFYNHLTTLRNGQIVLYNFLTGALFELEKANADRVQVILNNCNGEFNQEMNQLKEQLIQNYFLISADAEELDIIRTRNMSRRFNSLHHHLVVMPTLDCNFACNYCYESRVQGFMDRSVQQGIIQWMEEVSKTAQTVSIGWFGGEPLLDFSIVEHINEEVIQVCEENDCKFWSGMTTNGYLLNDAMIGKLDHLRINGLQITIDGIPESHNRYRPLRNGGETFDVIFHNILKVLDQSSAKINLRVNVDQYNYPRIPELLDLFPNEYRTDRLSVYFRSIFCGPNESVNDKEDILSRRLETKDLTKLYQYALDHGFRTRFPVINTKEIYCESGLQNYFVIHPSGEIYKCTVEFEKGTPIGRIREDSSLEFDPFVYSKWLAYVPGDDEKCRRCKFLPICNGGCRYGRLNKKEGSCPYEIKDLDGMVELLYFATLYSRQEKEELFFENS